MPKSKTRTRPAPRADKPAPRPTPEKALETATLALTEASQQLVQEAELRIRIAARTGDKEKIDEALEHHHWLRTASLGLLVAWTKMAGLPDPREAYVGKD